MRPMWIKNARISISACAAAFAVSVSAQTAIDGPWTASFIGGGGGEREAEVIVKDSEATWKLRNRPGARGNSDPCIGRAFPMELESTSNGEWNFRVASSEVIAGCPDRKGSLKVIDAKTLEGHFENGTVLRLTSK
jgi:hypothetical protein